MKQSIDVTVKQAGLEFPLEWDGRIIAATGDAVLDEVQKALRAFGFTAAVSKGNASSSGSFVTYNVTLVFQDRAGMDQLSYALAAIPGVRVVL